MANRRRSFAPARRSTGRISPDWAFVQNLGPQPVAASTKILLGSFVATTADGTVLRTHVELGVGSDTTGEWQIGAFGLIVVSETAFLAGAASIPGPSTDASDSGWFVHQPILAQTTTGTTGRDTRYWTIDSKAMRKFPLGTRVVIMVENIQVTTGQFDMTFAVRLLAKPTQS